ncbi:MAG: hypothetical protein OCD01_04585 [Fibrobacterales bacterium]
MKQILLILTIFFLITACNTPTESESKIPIRYTIDVRDTLGNGIDSVRVTLTTADDAKYLLYTIDGGKAQFSPLTSYNNHFELFKTGYNSEVFTDNVVSVDSSSQIVNKIIPYLLNTLVEPSSAAVIETPVVSSSSAVTPTTPASSVTQ